MAMRKARDKNARPNDTNRMHSDEAKRIQTLKERRDEDLKKMVQEMSETQMRELLQMAALRAPPMMWDLLTTHRRLGTPAPPEHDDVDDDLSWCVCQHCRPMPTKQERKCCRFKPEHCLSRRHEMDLYILDPGVLGISTLFRADLLASNPDHSNRGRRHDAYRQFLLWRHGFLAEGIDRIIPSCVTWRIRNEYPSADGKYAGFVPHRFV